MTMPGYWVGLGCFFRLQYLLRCFIRLINQVMLVKFQPLVPVKHEGLEYVE